MTREPAKVTTDSSTGTRLPGGVAEGPEIAASPGVSQAEWETTGQPIGRLLRWTLAGLTVTLGGVFIAYAVWSTCRDYRQVARQREHRIVSSAAEAVDAFVHHEMQTLRNLSRFSLFAQRIRGPQGFIGRREGLLEAFHFIGQDQPLTLLDRRGRVLLRNHEGPGIDVPRHRGIRHLLEGADRQEWVEIVRDGPAPIWCFAVPIRDGSEVLGALVAELPVRELPGLEHYLQPLDDLRAEFCYDGAVLFALGRGQRGTVKTCPLPVRGLALRYRLDPSRAVHAALREVLEAIVLVACVCLGVLWGGSWLGDRWLVHPLQLLRRCTAAVVQDERPAGLPAHHAVREIGCLARDFAHMVGAIQQRTDELRRLNRRLLQERDRTDRLFETAQVVLLVLGADLRVQRINARGQTLLDCPRGDILGADWCHRFVPQSHRDGVEGALRSLLGGDPGSGRRFEAPLRTSSGATRVMAWDHTPLIDASGRVEAILCSGLDVTEQRAAERAQVERLERLRRHQQAVIELSSFDRLAEMPFPTAAEMICRIMVRAMEVARVSVWMFDEAGRRLDRCGYAGPPESPADRPLSWDRERHAALWDLLEAGRTLAVQDAQERSPWSEMWGPWLRDHGIASLLIAPIRLHGRVVGMICHEHVGSARHWHSGEVLFAGEAAEQVARVLLERQRLAALEETRRALEQLRDTHRDLQQMQSQLIQNEKLAAIGQLSAGVAHELNTPVGFVASNFETLRRYVDKIGQMLAIYDDLLEQVSRQGGEPLQEAARQVVRQRQALKLDVVLGDLQDLFEESRDGLERVTQIVRNLRDFSRVDQAAQRVDYDLNEGLRATLVVARNEIKYDADVETDFGEIPPVPCHSGQINQVFLNILVNAAQAIRSQQREDRGCIRVRTYATEDHVVCEISDDGPGMPPEVRRRIFEPFFTTKPPGQGTGLGMSVSYDIVVQKHGGRLEVDSTPGRGTTFVLALPLQPLGRDSDEAMAVETPALSGG